MRLEVEVAALRMVHELCPEHVPQVLHFDPEACVLVMQFLPPPHTKVRQCCSATKSSVSE